MELEVNSINPKLISSILQSDKLKKNNFKGWGLGRSKNPKFRGLDLIIEMMMCATCRVRKVRRRERDLWKKRQKADVEEREWRKIPNFERIKELRL